MIDFTVARDKLAQFQCSDEIANFLRFEGVKGIIGLADVCPIAQWMRQTTGQPVCVSVVDMWIETDEGPPHVEAGHTDAMSDFVTDFDNTVYPDLIQEDEYSREF